MQWLNTLFCALTLSLPLGCQSTPSMVIPTPEEVGVNFERVEAHLPPVKIAVANANWFLKQYPWRNFHLLRGKYVYLDTLLKDPDLNKKNLKASNSEVVHFLANVCGHFTRSGHWDCQVTHLYPENPSLSAVMIKPRRN